MEEEIKGLIRRFKKGDTSSFEKLVEHINNRVSNIIYQLLGGSSSEVDDLAQEVFIKIYYNLRNFREEAKFSTWVYRITVNTVWDYLRKQKHRKTISLEDLEPTEPGILTSKPESVTREVQQKELKKLLGKLIQELPLKYRAVLILKETEGLPYKEIAKILRCSIGTVESRLFRARLVLKDKIQKSPWWRELV